MNLSDRDAVIIIGAGPAGLYAAHELLKNGLGATILEKAAGPGGISRTETYKGYRFDIGGHRFFTRDPHLAAFWKDLLKDQLLERKRFSRIIFDGSFFHYPLEMADILKNVGLARGSAIMASYLAARLNILAKESNFEDWIVNRFGRRLYTTFFEPYTEKVWGIPCREIQIDWARQRIGQLSLRRAIINALSGIATSKTQIDRFHYPATGPGLMWQQLDRLIGQMGGAIHYRTEAIRIEHRQNRVSQIVVRDSEAREKCISGSHYISSMPLSELVRRLSPEPPETVLSAARNLIYRDFMVVNLIVDQKELFPDQWLYIQDRAIHAGRIQNYKNWSRQMVPDESKTSVGMEYFCFQGDDLWRRSDEELIQLAKDELAALHLAERSDVLEGVVIRQPKAYPVYNDGFRKHIEVIRNYLSSFSNLQTIGRNGMHRYNNMDHSMLTGMMAARNIACRKYDLWQIDEWDLPMDGQEIEKVTPLSETAPAFSDHFSKMDKLACGTATGAVAGVSLFLATLWLIIKGGPVIGPNLQLLSQYFYGYTVTVPGAFLGLVYGAATGFAVGWAFALVRNLTMAVIVLRNRNRRRLTSIRDFINHL